MKNIGTILFVEDDCFDQELLRDAILRTEAPISYRILNSGEEAIAYLKGEREFADRSKYEYPSFIVTDLKMPCGDGFSLLRFMRELNAHARVPVVVLSSSNDLEDVQRCYHLGAAGYLDKPTSFDDLVRVLHVLLEFWRNLEPPPIGLHGFPALRDQRRHLRRELY